jgi:hypothetical protein
MALYCALKLVENVHDVISNGRELIIKYGHYLFSQTLKNLTKNERKKLVNGETSHSQFIL